MGKHSKNKNQKSKKQKQIKQQMTKISGGVKQQNTSISSFTAVFIMISTLEAILTLISYSSLKGFVFRLDIPNPANSQFFSLNSNKTAFTEPVVSLILKIEILSESEERLSPLTIEGVNYSKVTDKTTDFHNEAKIQQDIYRNTVWPNGLPITLSVADFSYFDIDNSYILIDKLLTIANPSDNSSLVLNYIKRELSSNIGMANYGHTVYPRKLGMITMELANIGFIELSRFTFANIEAYKLDCLYALAENIVLFSKLKKINYDCHLGNVMANPTDINPYTLDRAHLIDFGRVLDILTTNGSLGFWVIYNRVSNNTADRTQTQYVEDRDRLCGYHFTQLYNTETIYPDSAIPENIVFLVVILRFISCVDYAYNSINFNFKNHDKPQMSNFLRVLYNNNIDFVQKWTNQEHGYNSNTIGNDAPKNWFPILGTVPYQNYQIIAYYIEKITTENIGSKNNLSRGTIDTMIRDGRMVNLNKNISDYQRVFTNEFLGNNTLQANQVVTMEEGGRRRKYRISRKYRKTYKK